MKFGIRKTSNGIICVNCNKLVSKKVDFEENFCADCGAPLKPDSFDEYLHREYTAQLKVLQTIEKELKKHTIKKILTDLKEDLDNKLKK